MPTIPINSTRRCVLLCAIAGTITTREGGKLWLFSSRTLCIPHSLHSGGSLIPSSLQNLSLVFLGNLVSSACVALCCRKSLGDTVSGCMGPPFAEGDICIGAENCGRALCRIDLFSLISQSISGESYSDCTQMMRQCVPINVFY